MFIYVVAILIVSFTMKSLGLSLNDPEWWIIIGSMVAAHISGKDLRKND